MILLVLLPSHWQERRRHSYWC